MRGRRVRPTASRRGSPVAAVVALLIAAGAGGAVQRNASAVAGGSGFYTVRPSSWLHGPQAHLRAPFAGATARPRRPTNGSGSAHRAPTGPPALQGVDVAGVDQTQTGGWNPPDTDGAVGR